MGFRKLKLCDFELTGILSLDVEATGGARGGFWSELVEKSTSIMKVMV